MNNMEAHGNKHNDSRKQTAKNTFLAIGSWIVMPFFGLLTLFFVALLSYVLLDNSDATSGSRSFILMGIFGVILLLYTIAFVKRRRNRVLVRHATAGLVIGVCIYTLFILGGGVTFFSQEINNANKCTTLEDQLTRIPPATVPIATDKGTGTAFAVDGKGTLLSAYHVVEGANRIYANYVSGEINIKVLQAKPEFDLVLLKMSKSYPAQHLELTSNYQLGDDLYVFGYPGNAYSAGQGSLSKGIVSRVISNADLKLNFPNDNVAPGLQLVQTDAPVNSGNSGGPVVSKCGVVGVATAISDSAGLHERLYVVSEQGISYAVSSKTAASAFRLPIKNQ